MLSVMHEAGRPTGPRRPDRPCRHTQVRSHSMMRNSASSQRAIDDYIEALHSCRLKLHVLRDFSALTSRCGTGTVTII